VLLDRTFKTFYNGLFRLSVLYVMCGTTSFISEINNYNVSTMSRYVLSVNSPVELLLVAQRGKDFPMKNGDSWSVIPSDISSVRGAFLLR
jgi:hypothetical protein